MTSTLYSDTYLEDDVLTLDSMDLMLLELDEEFKANQVEASIKDRFYFERHFRDLESEYDF